MSDLPTARVHGARPHGKLPILRVRVSCHVCHAGPMAECDWDEHNRMRDNAKQSSWYLVWAVTGFRRPSVLRIPPGEHPWPETTNAPSALTGRVVKPCDQSGR